MSGKRYPGIPPFSDAMANMFFGRETDCEILYDFLTRHTITVLYAGSGAGKTSLIEAGLLPKLKYNGYLPIKIRFTSYQGYHQSHKLIPESGNLLSIFKASLQEYIGKTELDDEMKFIHNYHGSNEFERVWWYLKMLQNNATKVVLILDQFEEVFTYPHESTDELLLLISILVNKTVPSAIDDHVRHSLESFSDEQLQQLYNPINTKILLGLREDKLSLLNNYSFQIPDLVANFFRLPDMTKDGIRRAIEEPGKISIAGLPFIVYEPGVPELIIRQIADRENLRLTNLQIILQHIEERSRIDAQASTNQKFIVRKSSIGPGIIKDYFEGIISSIVKDAGPDNAIVDLFVNDLIDQKTATRNPVTEGRIVDRIGLAKLKELVNEKRILIKIPFPDRNVDIYELSHESCVQPIIEFAHRLEDERKKQEQIRAYDFEKRKRRRQIAFLTIIVVILLLASGGLFWLQSKNQTLAAKLKRSLYEEELKQRALDSAHNHLDSSYRELDSINGFNEVLLESSAYTIHELEEERASNKNLIKELQKSNVEIKNQSEKTKNVLNRAIENPDFREFYRMPDLTSRELELFEPTDYASLFTNAGDSLMLYGNYKLAISAYNVARSLDPDLKLDMSIDSAILLDHLSNQVQFLYRFGDYSGAISYAKQILQRSEKCFLIASLKSKMENTLSCIKETVIFSNNGLSFVSSDFFPLELDCDIEYFPKDVLNSIIQIKELDLSNDEIKYLPYDFFNLAKLKYLNLSNNKLQNLPVSFNKLESLTTLILANSKYLEYLPIGMTKLQHLNLSNCRNFNFRESTFDFKKLTWLDISYNSLTEIPDSVYSLKNLNYLNVGGNLITNISPRVKQLKELRVISFMGSINPDPKPISIFLNRQTSPPGLRFICIPWSWVDKIRESLREKSLPSGCVIVSRSISGDYINVLSQEPLNSKDEYQLQSYLRLQ